MQKTTDAQVAPAIVNFLEKLDHQLYKAMQITTPSTLDYLYRLRDECSLLKTIDSVSQFLI